MKILIDTDELAEFFGEGWCSCDISTKEELKSFLVDFCKTKIEGKEEKEEPVMDETSPKFGSITYYERTGSKTSGTPSGCDCGKRTRDHPGLLPTG